MDDRTAIQKIKNGEINCFSWIVRNYSHAVYRLVRAKIYDKDEADDIVQNTFVNFYKAIRRFDDKRPVSSYLFQIAKNEMKIYFRSRKKTHPLDERIAVENEDNLTTEDYEKSLSLLPKNQKKALQLLIEGYSYKEIASQLKIPINTVRTLIRRGRLAVLKHSHENT
jgi:RNA polymerase sigma-70 factor (ECF subfamily)